MLVFDIETNGLLDKLTHVKCLNMIDTDTGIESRFTDSEFYEAPYLDVFGDGRLHVLKGAPTKRTGTIAEGLKALSKADIIAGQNIIGFDIPAIRKVYPAWTYRGSVIDTVVMSRVMYTNLRELDFALSAKGHSGSTAVIESGGAGSHSLKPWGLRLGGEMKADFLPSQYGQTWNDYSFSEDCDDYCMQDVRTNLGQLTHFQKKGYAKQCLDLEHGVAEIVFRQEQYGWLFDVKAAEKLVGELQARLIQLDEACAVVFRPWYVYLKKEEGKNHAPTGTVKGAPWSRLLWKTFNPGSRDHIADRLTALYGWEPADFTPGGKPKIDETVLGTLAYPEAQVLAEHFTVVKRLAQLAEGKQSWLKAVKKDGRIHGRVNTNGAVTGRMTHSNPNVAQADTWAPMRACWIVPPQRKLVGCDADGLELRMLAHYMAKYDGGKYADIVVNGVKSEGTDVHSMNMKALMLNSRDTAKTWIYAFLYGAGNFKLGNVVVEDFTQEKKDRFNATYQGDTRKRALTALGKKSRDRMAKGFPALAQLIENVKGYAKKQGCLVGLDGRKLHVRSEHAALNTLLQSAGAVVMKQALVLLDADLSSIYTNSSTCRDNPDYEYVGNIHDEIQIETKQEIADEAGRRASEAIRRAGVVLGLECPLDGGSAVGDNWSATH